MEPILYDNQYHALVVFSLKQIKHVWFCGWARLAHGQLYLRYNIIFFIKLADIPVHSSRFHMGKGVYKDFC